MTIASRLKYIYSIIIIFQNGMDYLVLKSPQAAASAVKLTSDKSETIYTTESSSSYSLNT